MPRFRVNTAKTTVKVGLRVNLHPSHIDANALSGTIECEVDEQGKPRLDQPYSAVLTLPVEAIKSGNGMQDREMRRRFDVSKFPTITATVTHGETLRRRGPISCDGEAHDARRDQGDHRRCPAHASTGRR